MARWGVEWRAQTPLIQTFCTGDHVMQRHIHKIYEHSKGGGCISWILKCERCKTFSGCYIILLHAYKSYFHRAFHISAYITYLDWDFKPLLGKSNHQYEERDVCYNKNCLNGKSKKESRFQRYHLFSFIERYYHI